jgi:hypothetical protein
MKSGRRYRKKKKMMEEVKAFIYTDIIGSLANKGFNNLSSGEQLKCIIL